MKKRNQKMKKLRTLIVVAMIAAMSLMFITDDVSARGGSRGGGSRSFSSSRSKPASRPSKTRVAPKRISKPKSSSKRSVTTPKRTPAQQKSFETAKKNGTVFKSKTAAQSAFKKNNAAKYPSTYKTKPATRPSHIPQTTMVGGKSVNVIYNVDRGCYGYGMGSAFSPYNSFADLAMLSILMRQNHYVVNSPTRVVVQQQRASWVCPVTAGIVIFGILATVILLSRKKKD